MNFVIIILKSAVIFWGILSGYQNYMGHNAKVITILGHR